MELTHKANVSSTRLFVFEETESVDSVVLICVCKLWFFLDKRKEFLVLVTIRWGGKSEAKVAFAVRSFPRLRPGF